MSDNNDKIQSCQQAFSYHNREFKSCAVNAQDFNSELISPNINNDIEGMQNRIDEMKASSNNFSSTFSPILQMDNVHLLNHQLQIAKKIRSFCHLYQNFCLLYDKEASDRSILDIMKLFHIYSKLNSSISQYVKIQVCDKIKKEVDQKIINIKQMIVETIHKKGYENLTSTELFQLIILSSSVVQFWEFLDLDESQFTTDKYETLPDNIENLFLLFSKIEKLSNILNQSGLNEYLNGLKDKKAHFTEIIVENIKKLRTNQTKIKDFKLFSDNIFKKLAQLRMINQKESIPIEFKNILDKEISNVAIVVFITLENTDQSQFPENMKDSSNHENQFLLFLNDLNSKIKLYANPEKYKILDTDGNFRKISALYKSFILSQFKKGFDVMLDLVMEIMQLTTFIKNDNQEHIRVFKLIFYEIAQFELNSIIFTLLTTLNIKSRDENPKKFSFLSRDENLAKSFKKNEIFKNQYESICSKIDANNEETHAKLFNIIAQLDTIVEEKNQTKYLYENQRKYVKEIFDNFNSQNH